MFNGYSQVETLHFNHFNAKSGLSQNSIFSILQDSEGFLWIGTHDGINKYDGYKIDQYKSQMSDSNTISDNYIRTIFEDSKNRLWIGTDNGGLNRYDRKRDLVIPVLASEDDSLDIKSVFSIIEDSDNNLWISTLKHGIVKYNPSNNTFSKQKFISISNQSFPKTEIRTLLFDNEGILWAGFYFNEGLAKIDISKNSFELFKQQSDDPNNSFRNSIYTITMSRSGDLLIGTKNGISIFNRSDNSYKHFVIFNDRELTHINSLVEDKFGNIWGGSSLYGLCVLNPISNEISFFRTDNSDVPFYDQIEILKVYLDESDILWIGLNGTGLKNFNIARKFKNYSHTKSGKSLLSAPSVRSIVKDHDNALWLGDYGGLNRYEADSKKVFHFSFDEKDPNSIQNNNIYSLLIDNRNNLLVGTEGNGLFVYNRENNAFKLLYKPLDLYGNFIFELYSDSKNNIWVGSKNGIVKIKNELEDIEHIKALDGYSIFAIHEDRDSRIWIGTESDGILILDSLGIIKEHLKKKKSGKKSLSSNKIKSIYKDKSGNMWIGTNGAGLIKIDSTYNDFQFLNTENGLANNVIYGILEDEDQNLWLSSNKGLSRLNIKDLIIKNYIDEDGLQNNEFNTGAFYKSNSGEMFFGGINGLNSFYPEQIFENRLIPKIQITDFKMFNKSVNIGEVIGDKPILSSHISKTESIVLKHFQNFISFEFSALSYNSPEKNKYAYKLLNFEDDWVYTDSKNRIATFTNLEAGEYSFVVKGSNEDGIWNEKGRSIHIVIIPPIWATWWAYTIYCISTLLFISLIIRWRTISTQRINVRLREMVDVKTKELFKQNVEIQSQYELISGVIESLTDPFYVIDINENKTVLENTAAKNSFIKSKLKEFEELSDSIITEVLESHNPILKQSTYVSDSGKLIDLEFSVYPVKNKDGVITQVINYWKNISVRKELERSIQLNLQMKSNELKSKILRVSNLREQLILISNAIESESNKLNGSKNDFDKINKRLKKLIEEEKNEFDFWYSEENKEFFDRLKLMNKTLTKRQLRICTLLRLNLNTKEIAEIFQLAPKTVEVYRSQIREKLAIPKEENLNKYISEI